MSGKFTFNVLLQIQERSSQFLGKYRLVHRGWQEDIVCGDCKQNLDGETTQRYKLALLVHEQVYFW